MIRRVVPLLALALAGGPALAAPAEGAGASRAVTPELLDAVGGELERALSRMKIPGAPAPYFIGYKLTEVEVNDVAASLGAVTANEDRHFVTLEAHVHVGDYERDNSNFVAPGRENLDGIATVPLPLEATPSRARRGAWLATDAAYKEALEQFRAKSEALASGAAALRGTPSYTKPDPVVQPEAPSVPALEPVGDLEARAEALSAVFRKMPHVRDSRVAFTSFIERRWYLNSEGTAATDARRVSGVLIVATSQAADGQELSLYFSRYAQTAAELPDDDALVREAERLADRLDELRAAPVVEPYTGPVLFEGQGATGVVRNTLAPRLSGTPPPIGTAGDDDLRLAGELTNRLGLRVVAPALSVTDDPTVSRHDGRFLIGGYAIDDEGVKAQKVEVIERGTLQALLMSRTPNKDQRESNGHARLAMPGGVFRGSATNLLVSSRGGMSPKALRRKLLAEARSQGLPYALVVKQFDDAEITANPELSRIELFQLLQNMNREAPPPVLLAYRLYPDGREELVRGVQLAPIDLRAWRDVLATGRKRTIKNFLASMDDPFLKRIAGIGPGFVPSGGIESAVVTPDLLFRELDVKASNFGLRPPPLVPAP